MLNGQNSIVDSGTTLFILSGQAYTAMQNYFQQNFCQISGICGEPNIWDSKHCLPKISDLDLLPPITIQLTGVNLTLSAHQYFVTFKSTDGPCAVLGIVPSSSDLSVATIFGGGKKNFLIFILLFLFFLIFYFYFYLFYFFIFFSCSPKLSCNFRQEERSSRICKSPKLSTPSRESKYGIRKQSNGKPK